ncbi:unnamed protein product [Cylindrotheca closterium]|uniref:Uncharacterized protein n=1 Tax=Cylindrotheca closterium TaxID=2856 RepID=A0AAD2FTY7_9STRA|nr:unnamed protein product [Cylindrotheca closterium]
MGGRANQGSGRGSKGRWNSNKKNSKTGEKKPSKKEMKFQTLKAQSKHPGSTFATFEELKDDCCRRLAKKKLDSPADIIGSVKDTKLKDFSDSSKAPRKYSNIVGDDDQKKLENEQFAAEWTSKNKEWNYAKRDHESNNLNLHATIIDMCADEMLEELRHEADYLTTLYENPIELLHRIKKFMTVSDAADYPIFVVINAIMKAINTRQVKNETVAEYKRRIEANFSAMYALSGHDFLNKFTKTKDEYICRATDPEKKSYLDATSERLMASTMLLNSYKPTHQSLTEGFLKTYSLKHLPESQRNQFPTTMETCGIVLERNEAIVLEAAKRKPTPNKGGDTKGKNRDKGKPNEEAPTGVAFAQHGGKGGGTSGVTCFCCGKKGHTCDMSSNRKAVSSSWACVDPNDVTIDKTLQRVERR